MCLDSIPAAVMFSPGMINGTQNTKIPLTWFQLLQILKLKLILRLGGLGQYKERVRSLDAPSSHTDLPYLRISMQGVSFVQAHQVTTKLHPPKTSPTKGRFTGEAETTLLLTY